MRNIMIDLETLSTASDAVILSIGAVEFDDKGNTGQKFNEVINIQSSINAGLRIDGSTIEWWFKQSPEARAAATRTTEALPQALDLLTMFYEDCRHPSTNKSSRVWGNGAAFDIPILENSYKATDKKAPWKYYDVMCFRTLRAMFPSVKPPEQSRGTYHNALDDALYQVEWYKQIRNRNNKPNQ